MSSTHAVHLSKAPIKREVITLSDSDDDDSKPEEKKVKKEEEESMPDAPPPPSIRVPGTPLSVDDADALREYLSKSERLRDSACRSARIAKRRAEFAEEQLDKHATELEVAKQNAEDARKKKLGFAKEKEEWARQKNEWAKEKEVLATENNLYKDKELELKEKLKEAQDKSELDKTRILDLTTKIAEYEGGKAPPIQKKPLKNRADPVNLLRLVHADYMYAVDIEKAVDDIRAMVDQCRRQHKGYEEFMVYGANTQLECGACGTKVRKRSLIDHFLTPDHVKKVSTLRGAAVPLHAMLYWEKLLKDAAVAAAAAAAAEAAAALAALPTKQQPAESGENSDQEAEY